MKKKNRDGGCEVATSKDVAEYAGVSVATVSYVVNHTKHVTPEVQARVKGHSGTSLYSKLGEILSLVTVDTARCDAGE